MHVEIKDIVSWITMALSLGGLFEWVRGRMNSNSKKIREVDTKYSTEISDLRSQLTTENKEPRFLTYRAHDKICERQQSHFEDIMKTVDKHDAKLEAILVAVTTLQASSKSDAKNG